MNPVEKRFELDDDSVLVSYANPTSEIACSDQSKSAKIYDFQEGHIEKPEPTRFVEQNDLLWGGFFL